MGRTRTHNPLGLDAKKHARLYAKHGAFYYFHRGGRWERLGTDLAEAKRKAALYNDPESSYGSMKHFLDLFVMYCEQRVARGELAPRTYEDYKRDVEPLKDFFGRMTPASVEPKHVARYLDAGAELGRPVRANREKACLSVCFAWLVRGGDAGVKTNPCSGVRRNKEKKRERYVEHDEYGAVYRMAAKPVQILMELIYRTLQRPEDIILWTRANIVTKREGDSMRRILRNKQGKTGAVVDIEITPTLDAVLQSALNDSVPSISKTLVHTRKGEPYVYSGLTSMLQRYTTKAGLAPYGFYDLKAKGATDMWLAGVPLEQIQVLCGHESVTTTEIYVKCRWRGTVQPNSLPLTSNKSGGT